VSTSLELWVCDRDANLGQGVLLAGGCYWSYVLDSHICGQGDPEDHETAIIQESSRLRAGCGKHGMALVGVQISVRIDINFECGLPCSMYLGINRL
jgi:hypothetical protein